MSPSLTGQNASSTKPIDMSRTFSSYFRQDNLNVIWANLNVTYLKCLLYRDSREVGYVIFDAQWSNYTNWFAKERVVDASWSDLTKAATYNNFSIVGDWTSLSHQHPVWRMSRGYRTCCGHRKGRAFNMDKHPRYPQFVYADLNSADLWEKQQFGRADYMAIFVSH